MASPRPRRRLPAPGTPSGRRRSRPAVSVSVSASGIGGGSTSSSGFSDTHRHRRAVLNISPASTRWLRTVFGERPVASFVDDVPLERLGRPGQPVEVVVTERGPEVVRGSSPDSRRVFSSSEAWPAARPPRTRRSGRRTFAASASGVHGSTASSFAPSARSAFCRPAVRLPADRLLHLAAVGVEVLDLPDTPRTPS